MILATVEEDVRDIGKGIVASIIKTQGVDVIDLGRDVAADEAADLQRCLCETVMPILYGGMTNLGSYTRPTVLWRTGRSFCPRAKSKKLSPLRKKPWSTP